MLANYPATSRRSITLGTNMFLLWLPFGGERRPNLLVGLARMFEYYKRQCGRF